MKELRSMLGIDGRNRVQRPARRVLAAAMAVALGLPLIVASADTEDTCFAPVDDPAPGTEEWRAREWNNWTCSREGATDQDLNLATRLAYAQMRADPDSVVHQGLSNLEADPLRYPPLRWDGLRGNWRYLTFTAPYGDVEGPAAIGQGVVPDPAAPSQIGAQLFAPLEECTEGDAAGCPSGMPTHPPGPYPIVVLQGGSMGNSNEMQWLAEQLAENGYVVMTSNYFNSSSGWVETIRAMIDFMVSTPGEPSPSGEVNPWWEITDRDLVGMAGYSKWSGGPEVTRADPRIDAMVYQGAVAASARAADSTVPGLFFGEEYFGGPPRSSPPAMGVWDVASVANASTDLMQVTTRASTHYEFATLQSGGVTLFPRSRYGQQMQGYYARAWFDKYLWGTRDPQIAADATDRLTADEFDDSLDASSIGTGTFDLTKALEAGDVLAGNEPVMLAGRSVADGLSFYFPSAYSLDGGALKCLDMRAGCST